jgi:hypothetical protein
MDTIAVSRLVKQVIQAGLSLTVINSEQLRVTGPYARMTDELHGTLRTHKPAIITFLLTYQERIDTFISRPCASCGSYDYAFFENGRLICPCYFTKLAENEKPCPPFATAYYSEASRGLADKCCQCKEKPVYFGAGCTPYCELHKPESFMDALLQAKREKVAVFDNEREGKPQNRPLGL